MTFWTTTNVLVLSVFKDGIAKKVSYTSLKTLVIPSKFLSRGRSPIRRSKAPWGYRTYGMNWNIADILAANQPIVGMRRGLKLMNRLFYPK